MRVLYADAYLHSLNPSNTLMSNLIASAVDDISFYGPGFLPESLLELGLLRYIELTGPYDALVLGPNIPLFARTEGDISASVNYALRYTALSSSNHTLEKYFNNILDVVPKAPIPLRFACLVTLDYYGCGQAHIDRIEQFGLHIIAPNSTFSIRLEDLPEWSHQEAHFRRKKHLLSNAWTNFVTQNPERVLTTLHFVSDSEFSFRGIAERSNLISIPGVEYVLRKQAILALESAGIKYSSKHFFNLFRLADNIRLPVFSRFASLKLFNTLFFKDLIDARSVYTATGGFGTTVRKFFEIPAAGSLMICSPPIGFSDLGFRSGEHYINAEPDQLPGILKEVEADPDYAQAIASVGRQLVFDKHSLRARASQLRSCFDAVRENNYKGAFWNDGVFSLVIGPPSR